jgi:crotonobetainyl-CoA:carnitine CoA-transferase CaiB-like acyl-CoA transferase
MTRGRSDDGGLAERHARVLLAALGLRGEPTPLGDHPAIAWRRAGLKAITGRADGPGLVAPVALTAAADGALAALRAVSGETSLPENGAVLLGERARRLQLARHGRVSANQTCRLLDTADGRIALNLPRPDDLELLPALLGEPAADLAQLERQVARRSTAELLEAGGLLGLAIAADRVPAEPDAPFRIEPLGGSRAAASSVPLVVDLSSLWAGPLAGSLLQGAGARVVKVESRRRPDGARNGPRDFFDLLNGGKSSVALDFRDDADLKRLHALVASADIVIEASRPRALLELGIEAEAEARRGAVWVSITAHGRTGQAAQRIGFGDDAAVAGGLSAHMRSAWGESLFAGDAIADPLTGITAALAAWASWLAGGGRLVSLALAEVTAHACALARVSPGEVRSWQAVADADPDGLYPLRTPSVAAQPFGADTERVLAGL